MTPMLSIAYQPTEPEETNPEPVTDTIEDILHSLDISEAQGRSEAQEAEQQAIDEIFLDTLNSLDAIEWTKDELGEAETDELLRASEGEEEKEVTMEEQPPNIIEAPFSCVDIRSEAQEAEQQVIDEIFLDTLNSLDAIEWTKDELGEGDDHGGAATKHH